ncbi:MAG: hypothetical protein EU521_01725 [Promethearchaeota archaeon]|nr:MAG: hypothetical protein EU521_01725 [Candidatus Lokiarchaeota archaeon]
MSDFSNKFKVFELDADSERFEIVKSVGKPIEEILDSKNIFLILDPIHSKVWLWNGLRADVQHKFIAAQLAHNVRNQYAVDFNICAVDENKESDEFKEIETILL